MEAQKIDYNSDVIKWWFKKKSNGPDIKGTLLINYEVVIWTSSVNNCEQGAGFSCYRFVPKVSYSWNSPEPAKSLDPRKTPSDFLVDLLCSTG